MDDVFSALRAIMVPHTKQLDVKHDEPGNFHVDTFHIMKNGKPLFFGAVQIKSNRPASPLLFDPRWALD